MDKSFIKKSRKKTAQVIRIPFRWDLFLDESEISGFCSLPKIDLPQSEYLNL